MPRLEWQAPVIASPERTTRWYIVFASILLAFVVYGIVVGNWSFVLAIVVIGGTYYLVRNNRPPLHRLRIENGGFLIDDEFSGWSDCKDFWFIKLPQYTELHIAKKKVLTQDTIIQTGPADPDEIRSVLSEFLPERSDQPEEFSHALIRILKL